MKTSDLNDEEFALKVIFADADRESIRSGVVGLVCFLLLLLLFAIKVWNEKSSIVSLVGYRRHHLNYGRKERGGEGARGSFIDWDLWLHVGTRN